MMVSLILLTIGCVALMLILLVVGVAIIVMVRSGDRDVVSTARQGWINRRSRQDQDGW
jgi:hypothetical protein